MARNNNTKKRMWTRTGTKGLVPSIYALVFFVVSTGKGTRFANSKGATSSLMVDAFAQNSASSITASPWLPSAPLLCLSTRIPLARLGGRIGNPALAQHPQATNDVVCYSDLVDLVSGADYMDPETKDRLLRSLDDRFVHKASPAGGVNPTIEARMQTQTQNMEPERRTEDGIVPTIEGSWTDSGDRFHATGAWQSTPLLMKGAFLDDVNMEPTSKEYPFPTWEEVAELACIGGGNNYDEALGNNDGDDHDLPGLDPNGEYFGQLGEGDDADDLDAWIDEDDDDEDGGEAYYVWDDDDDDEINDDVAPSRVIQYSWPSRKGEDGVDSDYYQADVNTNWLDTFEIKQFGPFSDPSSLEALLRIEDGVDETDQITRNANENIARTLLVNDVDRWIPKLSEWMDRRFNSNGSGGSVLPARWRRDDAQISLSYPAGGIGPHVDDYDVFLIQVAGERTWDILWADEEDGDERSESCGVAIRVGKVSVRDETDSILPESSMNGVRIVNVTKLEALEEQRFGRPRTKMTRLYLRPGDCLYLPPRVLHCGTALKSETNGECMTLSVGCRAPSALELLDGLSDLMKKSAVAPTSGSKAGAAPLFPSDVSVQSFHKRYTNSEMHRGEQPSDGSNPRGRTSSKTSHSPLSSWLSPVVKDEMRALVLDAVRIALDDDENVLDPLVGRFVTRSNRLEEDDFGGDDSSSLPSFSYPKPLRTLANDGADVWANATTALEEIFCAPKKNGGLSNSFLKRAEGIAFAWSCVCDQKRQVRKYRLYAQGRPPFEVFESLDDVVVGEKWVEPTTQGFTTLGSSIGRLIDRIANGPPFNKSFVVDELKISVDIDERETKNSVTWFLHALIEEGLLYGEHSGNGPTES